MSEAKQSKQSAAVIRSKKIFHSLDREQFGQHELFRCNNSALNYATTEMSCCC